MNIEAEYADAAGEPKEVKRNARSKSTEDEEAQPITGATIVRD